MEIPSVVKDEETDEGADILLAMLDMEDDEMLEELVGLPALEEVLTDDS